LLALLAVGLKSGVRSEYPMKMPSETAKTKTTAHKATRALGCFVGDWVFAILHWLQLEMEEIKIIQDFSSHAVKVLVKSAREAWKCRVH
jgi:hypothetical protein